MNNITLQTTPNGGAFDLVSLYAGDIDICSGTYYSTLSIDAFMDFSITGHGNVVFDGQNANPLLRLDSTSTSVLLQYPLMESHLRMVSTTFMWMNCRLGLEPTSTLVEH